MKNVKDFDVKGKRILVRCDFNVPFDEKGNIIDDFKIQQSLPTLQYLLGHGAEVVAMSHLGDGHENMDEVQKRLDELLGTHVPLMENLRANPGEEKNDLAFAKQLAQGFDLYVNDAFAVCHRAHASVVAITQFLPSCAGLLLQKEVKSLEKVLKNPTRPFVVVMGGSKVETKKAFIENISRVSDAVLLGSLLRGVSEPDINMQTIQEFTQKILRAKTVFWNGPLGKVEDERYIQGTRAVAKAIIASGAFSVVGGGQTIAFLRQEGMLDQFSHVSTGGGAMLEFLSGTELPGLKALE